MEDQHYWTQLSNGKWLIVFWRAIKKREMRSLFLQVEESSSGFFFFSCLLILLFVTSVLKKTQNIRFYLLTGMSILIHCIQHEYIWGQLILFEF